MFLSFGFLGSFMNVLDEHEHVKLFVSLALLKLFPHSEKSEGILYPE